MKKEPLKCFAGIFLAWIMTGVGYSQNPIVAPNPESPQKEITSSSEKRIELENSTPLRLNEINANAASTFIKDHGNVTNAKWFKSLNGLFVVYFTDENIKNWIFYNDRGTCEYMILHYYEEKLPAEVRDLLKTNYYDFNIYHVTEARRNGKIAYVAKMEDKTSWKTIKVVDGEIEVMEEYSKR
jgi:hypothetical protein